MISNDLITIKDLGKDKKYSIPDYQRGYRWDARQATDLLDDIEAFRTKEGRHGAEIYCLQPLVVSSCDEDSKDSKCKEYRVVDGQQRLTTIHLMLTYFKEECKSCLAGLELPGFDISYDTRVLSAEFLNTIHEQEEEQAKENVDFYHMYIVYSTIRKWFQKKEKELKKEFPDEYEGKYKSFINDYVDVFLNKVQMIEYPVEKDQETDTFSRLNAGKIHLTDSELIKALFLNRNNFNEACEVRQQKIANEWYEIENALQNDEFWLFIHNRYYQKPTRIDFIFDLLSRNDKYEIKKKLGEGIDKKYDPEELDDLVIAFLSEEKNLAWAKKIKGIDDLEDDYFSNVGEILYNKDYAETLLPPQKYSDNKENPDGLKEALNAKAKDNLNKFKFRDKIDEGTLNVIEEKKSSFLKKVCELFKKDKEAWKKIVSESEYFRILDDKHGIYRYFNLAFEFAEREENDWVEKKWKEVKDYFAIFNEWYNDYTIYHYIGYLVAVKHKESEDFINECVKLWQGGKAQFEYTQFENKGKRISINNKDKNSFIEELKNEIVYKLMHDINDEEEKHSNSLEHNFLDYLIKKVIKKDPKKDDNYIALPDDLKNYITDQKKNNGNVEISECLLKMDFERKDESDKIGFSKRCCVNFLLLHNIETIIQYNEKLINNSKYTLPYFNRFPFHLYNNDNWDVEHIRPNVSAINKESDRKVFLQVAKEYFNLEESHGLFEEIDKYLEGSDIDKELVKEEIDDINKIDFDSLDKKFDGKPEIKKELEKHDENFGQICDALDNLGGKELPEEKKNKIYNYTLLDSSTNREYGNHVFPYKREYIAKKEKGIKLKYVIVDNKPTRQHELKNRIVEMIYIYTKIPDEDIKEKIKKYIDKIVKKSEAYETKNGYTDESLKVLGKKYADLLSNFDPNQYGLISVKKESKDGLKYEIEKAPEEAPFVMDTTRNVFTKYYSNKITTMLHWTQEDANDYWEDMKGTLAFYFTALDEIANSKKRGKTE